jgi:O-antigen ligase
LTAWLLLYLGVILVGWLRMVRDPAYMSASIGDMISEELINTVKWVVPAFMLYDGARDRARFRLALACVLGVYALLALQVIRWMPPGEAMTGGSLSERSLKILLNEIGFHRVNMSAMLAGASWAIFAARPLADTAWQARFVLLGSAVAVLGQALTAGRAGYVTWFGVGSILCLLRWRKYLLVTPVIVAAVLIIAPGVGQRMLEGFRSGEPVDDITYTATGPDVYTITAGRNLAWPLVIAKIKERPIVGYGREAMTRTGTTAFLGRFREGFSHPHNAYLEMLLDNGLLGFVIVLPFYFLMLWRSVSLFRDSRQPMFVAIGGVTSAFLLALLIAGMGSQTFYPREGWAGMWCAMFLMLRVYGDRAQWVAREQRVTATATARPRSWHDRRAIVPRAAAAVRRLPGVRPAATPSSVGTLVFDTSNTTLDPPGGRGSGHTMARPAAGARRVTWRQRGAFPRRSRP